MANGKKPNHTEISMEGIPISRRTKNQKFGLLETKAWVVAPVLELCDLYL